MLSKICKRKKSHGDFQACICERKWTSQVALVVKNLPANVRDVRDKTCGSDPGVGKIPLEEGMAPVFLGSGRFPCRRAPLQYSCLENPMGRGAWQSTVHRVTKSWTQLKQFSTCVYIGKSK